MTVLDDLIKCARCPCFMLPEHAVEGILIAPQWLGFWFCPGCATLLRHEQATQERARHGAPAGAELPPVPFTTGAGHGGGSRL